MNKHSKGWKEINDTILGRSSSTWLPRKQPKKDHSFTWVMMGVFILVGLLAWIIK